MNLPRHRRSQRGGKRPAPPRIEMPPMIKIITTKRYFFSVSFSIFAYTAVYVYNRLQLILTTRWPGPPQINFLPSNLNV